MRKICRFEDRMLAWVLLAVTALVVIAIGPAAGALPMKACQLITAADVQGVLGSGYAPQDVPGMGNDINSACAYTKGKDTAVNVSLSRIIYDSAQYLKMEQAGIKQQGGKVTVTPVSGLGEGAFYFVAPLNTNQPQAGFQLHFGKGTLAVILDVTTGGKPNIDAALKLGKIAYSRLR